ncbi:MAG: PAS domain-containing protein [Nitrospiraceae bacterium]|nr:PAS domain-containing protein [Nitrospiraceae bacterium]
MRRVCAWCRTDMGRAEGNKLPDSEISHGICPACVDNFAFQQGVSLEQFLDSLAMPVFVVDGDVIVKAVNKAGCAALGKRPGEMLERLGGNVFECAHARLPEGCGRTIHCSGCAIRRAVTKTFITGEPQCDIPATLTRNDADDRSAVALVITTVKHGDAVLLRVDRIEPQPGQISSLSGGLSCSR